MKFIHIADLHLGKIVCGHSMLELQKEVLEEILEYMSQKQIKIIVLAGDIYDRSVPPVEAVELFNEFITNAINKYSVKILMISGNHDSEERLNFGSELLEKQGLIIASKLKNEMTTHIIDDGKNKIVFHLLPFIKPSDVKNIFKNEEIRTYQDALNVVLSNHKIDNNYKNVMVTHQFVAGNSSNIRSESEAILSVGGTEIIDVHLFDDYDYVALGHLHAPQAISRETVKYSGSLLHYSFDEIKQRKGFLVVDTDNDFKSELIELHPSKKMVKYEGLFDELINSNYKKDDFIFFSLLDEILIPNAMDRLRTVYPNAMQLTYKSLEKEQNASAVSNVYVEKLDNFTLYQDFYKMISNNDLSEEQEKIISELLLEVEED